MVVRLSSERLVGRAVEMDALEAAFSRAQRGESAAVVIGGEAGVGKTRLVSGFTEQAEREGALVLAGGCIEFAGSGLPFAPITEALRGLLSELEPDLREAAFGSRRRELSRFVPELVGDKESDPDDVSDGARARLFDAFLALFAELGRRAPVVLVVEDVHWADASTRDLLAFVIHNLRSDRVMLCLTYRSDEMHRRHPLKPWLAVHQRESVVERILLDPLGPEQVAEQVAGILERRPDDQLVAHVIARSDGNPLFTEELVAAGVAEDGSDLPPTLVDLLHSRVETLSDRTQEIMRVASAAGRSVDHQLLVEVGLFAENELSDSLREAVEHHILVVDATTGSYTFRHALVREVVHDQLLPGERSRIHAAYARALSARSEAPSATAAAELAHHWYQAHDLPRALSASIDAGLAAEQAYAFPEAHKHLGRALELWDQVPDAGAIAALDLVSTQRHAANAAYVVGDPARSVALYEEALSNVKDGDRVLKGTILCQMGIVQRWGLNDDGAALESLRRSVELLDVREPTTVSVRSLGELAAVLALTGNVDEAIETAERSMSLMTEVTDHAARIQAHASMAIAHTLRGDSEAALVLDLESMRIAEELGDPDSMGVTYINVTDSLLRLGRFAEGAERAMAGAHVMRRYGHEVQHGSLLLTNACEGLIPLGRWDEVLAISSEILSAGSERTGNKMLAGLWRAVVGIRLGDIESARADLEMVRGMSEAVAQPQILAPLKAAEAESALMDGRVEEAAHAAQRSLDLSLDAIPGDVAVSCALGLRAVADLAEIARAKKDENKQQDLLGLRRKFQVSAEAVGAAHLSGVIPSYVSQCRAEVSRLEGASDPELWARARQMWHDLDCPYEEAYAGWRLAEALLRTKGKKKPAEESLRSAHDLADGLGAGPLKAEIEGLARRARIDLAHRSDAPVALERDGRFGLTTRELEVLELVAEGRTNPQIAEELFISPRTAGIHVSHILTKLGVSSRVEAATLAQRVGLLG